MGLMRGRKKGCITWNKGIEGYSTSWKGRHHSEETKKKLSKILKQRKPKEIKSLSGLHNWIKKHKEKPKICENCGKIAKLELANISGNYLKDINDFRYICRSCHTKEHGKIEKMLEKENWKNRERDKNGRFIPTNWSE